MESFWGSVKLMLFIYALAAAISLITAWMIKYIFVVIRMQKSRAEARKSAKAASAPTQGGAAPKGTV
jgi:flagellar basal body-associated protein FliL